MADISSSHLSSCGSTPSLPSSGSNGIINPSQDSISTRKRHQTQTWAIETSELVDDGFVWRKYGQKYILNSAYPRKYYRCANKWDEGCLATKQVQRIQENPPIYRTNYYGLHTCKSGIIAQQQTTTNPQSSNFVVNSNAQQFQRNNYPILGSESYIATANSKNYTGDKEIIPFSGSYNYREYEEEEESVMGPAYKSAMSPDSEMGKDLRLSQPSLSSHLPAATVSGGSFSSSVPSSPSSPSLRFDDVFCFQP